jgi:hypothetical protein
MTCEMRCGTCASLFTMPATQHSMSVKLGMASMRDLVAEMVDSSTKVRGHVLFSSAIRLPAF